MGQIAVEREVCKKKEKNALGAGGPLKNKQEAQRRPHEAQRRAQRKGTIFIDGPSMIIIDGPSMNINDGCPSMNSLMDVPMDFQFFEIQFFEKTMKKQWETIKKHGIDGEDRK